MPEEVWVPIPGWPYEVSSEGRFRRVETGRIKKAFPHKSGYLNVQLRKVGSIQTRLAHRVVAEAFLGPSPSPQHEVGHADGDRHNNRVGNLRWVTRQENMLDRDLHGTTARDARNGRTKHSRDLVQKIKGLAASGMRPRQISRALSVPESTVGHYIHGTRRGYVVHKDAG